MKRIRSIEGVKVEGIINFGIVLGLVIFLGRMMGGGQSPPFLCGLNPDFIGVGMLVYAFFLAEPGR